MKSFLSRTQVPIANFVRKPTLQTKSFKNTPSNTLHLALFALSELCAKHKPSKKTPSKKTPFKKNTSKNKYPKQPQKSQRESNMHVLRESES